LYAENDAADIIICERAFKLLEDQLQFRTVNDGRSVIDWLDGKGSYANRAFFPTPQILVLDSSLGDMKGLEVLRWVREQRRFKELPVILHMGSTAPHELHAYHELSVHACIEKQAGCRNLVECIMGIIEGELVHR
jgi:CheY-like chemotaxis protein